MSFCHSSLIFFSTFERFSFFLRIIFSSKIHFSRNQVTDLFFIECCFLLQDAFLDGSNQSLLHSIKSFGGIKIVSRTFCLSLLSTGITLDQANLLKCNCIQGQPNSLQIIFGWASPIQPEAVRRHKMAVLLNLSPTLG